MKTEVSIIYVYYNTPSEIVSSIQSINKAVGKTAYEVIIVDNNSSKGLPKEIRGNKIIKIIKNKDNLGYGKAANIGSKFAKGEYLLIVNPDTVFSQDSIKLLVQKSKKDRAIGIIGPKMTSKEGKTLPTISGMPSLPTGLFIYSFLNTIWKNNPYSNRFWLYSVNRNKEKKVDVVSGACMLIKKNLFEKVKGFDERFFMYFEESDLCFRVRKEGYKILFYPKAKIIHLIGKSCNDKDWVTETFQKSRLQFLRKYHGFAKALLAESFLRLTNKYSLLLILILLLSAFLNLYKINELMMFQGDFGRDYLAAREMLLTGKIPLTGIASSVIWLHQGPLSIYLISFALTLGNLNPIAPAILYAVIGVFSTILVYKLGKLFFNKTVGLLSSAFFATSPLIVVNARMPYHTSSIPFFSILFFLLLYKLIKGKRSILFFLFFILGILFLLELSNAVLFFLLLVLYLIYRPKITKEEIIKSISGFILGILPFIIYDFSHNFVQTGGFTLWVINRIRLFFGLTISNNSTTSHFGFALTTIIEQLARMIFPFSLIMTGLIVLLIILSLVIKKKVLLSKTNGLFLIMLWLCIPLFGYLIHAQPGTAYFPLIFPAFALLLGFSFYTFIRYKIFLLLFLFIISFNALSIVYNEYFLTTKNHKNTLPPNPYSFGLSYSLISETSRFILVDSKNTDFQIKGGGFLSKHKSSVDNYKYILFYNKGKISDQSKNLYIIYENKNEVPKGKIIIYSNNYIYITHDENK